MLNWGLLEEGRGKGRFFISVLVFLDLLRMLEGFCWCCCSLFEGLRDWKESWVFEVKFLLVDFYLIVCIKKKKKVFKWCG